MLLNGLAVASDVPNMYWYKRGVGFLASACIVALILHWPAVDVHYDAANEYIIPHSGPGIVESSELLIVR